MQYRHILLLSGIFLYGNSLLAQPAAGGAYKNVNTEKIVLKAGKSREEIARERAADSIAKLRLKKPVPLAGEKDYYGDMNAYVMDYVKKYHNSHNKTLNVVNNKSETPFKVIDTVLQQHELPKELKYLAVIESALNNKAISRVGAVGPWQFMASTARLMGLTVGKGKDERRDWEKSTNAAAKYLTYLYEDLNDWLLVIAAYNSGPTPVKRAMAKTGSNNFWDIKPYLPKETQGHVLAFIATATIFENLNALIGAKLPEGINVAEKYVPKLKEEIKAGKEEKPLYTPEELKQMAIVRITEPVQLEYMANLLGMNLDLLNKWNPDYELYEYKTYPSEEYKLRIPKEKLSSFLEKKDFITKKSREFYSEQNI